MSQKRFAEIVVDNIIADMTDRRGFRQEWDDCDIETQNEIRQTWINIVDLVTLVLLAHSSLTRIP